jgi:UbiD family decarboxylase
MLSGPDGADTMRDFIAMMREQGRVEDIERSCSTIYEAPRMASRTDKILFFHDLDGHRAVMNLLGDRKSLAAALGVGERDGSRAASPPTSPASRS